LQPLIASIATNNALANIVIFFILHPSINKLSMIPENLILPIIFAGQSKSIEHLALV
jgi:hypothetical protein